MAIRDDLISSAVTFLQDPSVANAPLDKRISFLKSKNLTQEEIDAALSQAENFATAQPPPDPAQFAYQKLPQARHQPPPRYGYAPLYQQPYWQQPPPPPVPRRDWRDYFIMATLMSGLSYGVYFMVKRYISPIISPPTPPQIEQDKSAIDASFTRAFELIEQLGADTDTLRASEEDRKRRLDTALSQFEASVEQMKEASSRRDDDVRRLGEDMRRLQDMVPKAMKAVEDNGDARLRDLSSEVRSLKTLVANRVSGGASSTSGPAPRPLASPACNGGQSFRPSSAQSVNGSRPQSPSVQADGPQSPTTANTSGVPESGSGSSQYGRFSSSKSGIPAWQMAASKNQGDSGIPAWQLADAKRRGDSQDQKATGDAGDAANASGAPAE